MPSFSLFRYIGVLPLLIVPVWAAWGAYKPWQGSFLWLCLWAWVCFFLSPVPPKAPGRIARFKKLLKDPLFWLSVLFLGYLTIQFLNSGRMQIFDFDLNQYSYSPPRWPSLPWAITESESLEMIMWFAPALSLFLILRHSWSNLQPRILIWIVCLNGFLNAMLAFVHQASGWVLMYNFQKFGDDVYGSFGYPNHGAVYFILLFAIALGLLFRELLSETSDRDNAGMGFALFWTPVFFLAANLSTSRAGILGAWLVLILTVISIAIIAWPRIHPVQRVYGLITMSVLIGALTAGFLLFTQPIHIRELQNATVNLNVYQEIESRFFQIESAWLMWLDHPVYGVGGWGYRYFVSQYIPLEEWRRLGIGKANVHNDFMQFLAEFGLIGFSLLMGVFLPMFIRLIRNFFRKPYDYFSLWANPLRIACMWGIVMLVLDSQFDIPLRSPAIMLHAIFMLYLLESHPEFQTVWSPAVDWKRLQPPLVSMKNRIWGVQPENTQEKASNTRRKKA